MLNISIKNIIVPVDGSIHARRALAMAADLADRYGARICLLYVMGEQPDVRPLREYLKVLKQSGGDEGEIASIEETLKKKGLFEGEELLAVWARLIENRQLAAPKQLIKEGKAGEEIVAAAEEIGADLIVMGRRGLGELKQALVGSVATHVQSNSNKPVLTLH